MEERRRVLDFGGIGAGWSHFSPVLPPGGDVDSGLQSCDFLMTILVFHPQAKEAAGRLPYWLSNTSALLCLLQKNLRSNGFFDTPSRRSAGGLGGKLAQAPKSTRPGKAPKAPGVGAQQPSNSHWDNIVSFLNLLMDTLRENHVPSFFIRKLITRLFSFVNIQLFNR
ncbi:Myosin-J heavy chain [Hordeum vulgare]|nr:Myosin-J heavy chain [Hordeum vulgare]